MDRKIILAFSVCLFAGVACAVGVGPTQPAPRTPQPTTTPRPTLETSPEASPTQASPTTPEPTFDFSAYLLTQAYAPYTPRPSTAQPSPTSLATGPTATGAAFIRSATPIPTSAASTLFINEPIQIANAVNTADCKISRVGNCTPTMTAGATLLLTWSFGVMGSQPFNWGNAAVIVTRDNQQFLWTQVGNGLVKPPEKDASWTLPVGARAAFRAGIENVQPGHYTARLMLCPRSPAECNANQGWQNVGGEAIDFVIIP